jgi:hypothetical protein
MVKRFNKFDPQLVVVEQLDGSAIALTNEAKLSLYKKSQKSGIPTNILETVYYRGYKIWNESFGQTPEQFAFDRVNSFIAGGFAADLDDDLITEDGKGYKNPTGGLTQKGRDHYNRTTGSHLKAPVTTPPSKLKKGSRAANRRKSFCARMGGVEGPMRKPNGEPTRKALALRKWNCEETQINEKTCNCWDGYKRVPGTKPCAQGSCARPSTINEKRGLWDNIHAKQERIKNGSGEHMRKPGSKGAPTAAALKNSQNEELIVIGETIGNVKTLKPDTKKYWKERHTLSMAKRKAANSPQPKMTSMDTDDLVKQYLAKGGSIKKEEYTGSDPKSSDPNNPLSRMDGTYSGAKVYADSTPGQKLAHTADGDKPRKTLKTIKKVMKEDAIADNDKLTKFRKDLADAALDQKINAVKVSVGGAGDKEPHPATQLPTKFADRKKAAQTTDTNTGVKKPDINGDIQRNINSRLAPVLGGLKQKMDGKFRQNSISRMSEENND